MKKTAVEWLYTQLQMNNEILEKGTRVHQEMEEKIFKQAKEMEKEQIEDAFREGMLHHTSGLFANEYFDKTFKSEEDETAGQND